MNAALCGAWLRSVVVGVCFFLGVLAGSWGLARWHANHIQSLIETRAALEFEIQEARQTIKRIEQTTWGVKLVEVDGRRFAILPERGGPHRLDHLAAFLRWTPQFLLPPVREILRGGEPEGKVPLRMFFQASVHLLRRRPSVRRVRSLAVV